MTTLRKHTSSPHRLDAAASRSTRGRARLLSVAGLLLAFALSACSGLDGSSGDDGAAASGDGGDGGGGGGSSDLSRDEQILGFYQCLRDGGLDVPDPDGSGGIMLEGIDPDDPDQMAVIEDCAGQYDLGGPGGQAMAQGDGNGELADPEALIDFATCMRDNGIDMPDPSPDGDLQMPEGLDRTSPEFQAAVEECREHLGGGGIRVTR